MTDLNEDALVKAGVVAALALDKKADGLKLLHVSEKTSYTDYLVICSAPSERQVQAVARNIIDELRLAGVRPLGQEGVAQGHWVLLDFGKVVAHIFLRVHAPTTISMVFGVKCPSAILMKPNP